MADINQGLVAYKAVPVNGVLQPITVPATGRLSKFQRPAFGNARIYTTQANKIYGIAAPGAPPPISSSSSTSIKSTSTSSSSRRTSTTSTSIKSTSTTTSSRTSKISSTSTSFAPYTTPAPPTGSRINLNWNITWVKAAPDGFSRPLIGINGQWPCPAITLNYGDILILTVFNGLGNESTAIHFHGINQNGTNFEDSPAMVTQCPIMPGDT